MTRWIEDPAHPGEYIRDPDGPPPTLQEKEDERWRARFYDDGVFTYFGTPEDLIRDLGKATAQLNEERRRNGLPTPAESASPTSPVSQHKWRT